MLNRFAIFLLVATSLSPILGAIAVNQISQGRSWREWVPWLVAAAALALICWLLLKLASTRAEECVIEVQEFERNDKEVLAFLLAYLLPFLSSESMAFDGHWLTGTYIIGLIFVCVAHAGALHFNPVMGLFGYHFYNIKAEGVGQLLISRRELRRLSEQVTTVRLAAGIYLCRGNDDAA